MTDFAAERERMIDRTIAGRGLDDPALIAAFRAVPREAFISGPTPTMPMPMRRCRSKPARPSASPISSP